MQIQQRKRVDIGADIFTVCIRTWIDEILNAIHLVHAQIVGIDEQIYFSSFGKALDTSKINIAKANDFL